MHIHLYVQFLLTLKAYLIMNNEKDILQTALAVFTMNGK